METDKLKDIWQSTPTGKSRTSADLEEIIHLSVQAANSRLQQRIRLDLLLAVSFAIVVVLVAYAVGLKYWLSVAASMAGFFVLILVLYWGHRRAVSISYATERNLRQLILSARNKLNRLAWTYRISIALFTGLLYAYLSYYYQLYSFLHILWVLPVTLLVTELVIRWMYGQAILDYDSWYQQLERLRKKED